MIEWIVYLCAFGAYTLIARSFVADWTSIAELRFHNALERLAPRGARVMAPVIYRTPFSEFLACGHELDWPLACRMPPGWDAYARDRRCVRCEEAAVGRPPARAEQDAGRGKAGG